MIRKALIRDSDGFVANVVSLPNGWKGRAGEWQIPPGHSVIDAGTGAPGDTWDGALEFIKAPIPPPPPDLDALLDEAIDNATSLVALKAALRGRIKARSA